MHAGRQIVIPEERAEALPGLRDGASVHDRLDPALAAEWAALAAHASEANAFAEPWFIAASLAAFGHDGVRLLTVSQHGALIGVMPVVVETGYGRTPVRFVQNWCHHQMFLGTPLIRAGEEETFWREALDLLDWVDWAPGFFHLRGVVENGPVHRGLIAARQGAVVYRETRALLQSDLGPQAYYEQSVRQKKRKELRRLRNRLAELGDLRLSMLTDPADLPAWTNAFLVLEKSGWKGEAGSALGCAPETESFFFTALAGAWEAGKLQFLRLDLNGHPVAMLVNFLSAPGSFSFKTTFDEAYARFSPGVLIQLENLAILDRPGIAWMDSCAVENHPMIDSLWRERRHVVRVTVPLAGLRRRGVHAFARTLETLSTLRRRLFTPRAIPFGDRT